MTEPSIRLSPKHGVNPAIPKCFVCGEDKNEILLVGLMRGDREAPKSAAWNTEPCDQCLEHMKTGVILISVRDGEEESNPYRTGGWAVVRDEAITRMVSAVQCDQILEKRMAFVPDEVWDALGLPRGGEA